MKIRVPIRFMTTPALLRATASSILLAASFMPCALNSQETISAAPPQQATPVVLDRAVAIVNKHVILASDLQNEMRLSILEPNRGGELTPQLALDQLISRTLIEQQIREEDQRSIEPTPDEVAARLTELRKVLPACVQENCATDEGWKSFLAEHGLTPQRVESYLRYRLEILGFIEQRFRQGIQISPQQIDAYYRNTLLPQYKSGETPPALDQVAPRIQEILLQQQVDDLFDNWLKNLRQQGEVEVLDPALEAPDAQKPQGSTNQ